jgi:3-isopropylmalate/(R)-2-methylmalate dehydratase large subunit
VDINEQTIAEQILSRAAGQAVSAGDFLSPQADLITVHDWYTVNAFRTLQSLGVDRLAAPDKVLLCTDHEPLAVSPAAFARQRQIAQIAQQYGIKAHYPAGRGGLGHVFPVEKGIVRPGMFVLAYDTHVTNYGAIGALGIPVLTEIAEVLALGSVWVAVPETLRIDIVGRLGFGVSARDAAQKIIGSIDQRLFEDAVVEFGGEGLAGLDIDARFTLCNTPLEVGAVSAIFEVDEFARDFAAARTDMPVALLAPGTNARYRDRVTFDLSGVSPQVALPPTPDNVVDVAAIAGTKIQHAYIGSCASGMITDMRAAAEILRGRRIDANVRLIITPATQEVMEIAAREGLIQIFAEAGAMVTVPGCGVCAGGRIGGVTSGETSIGTGTRNEPGRLGAHDAVLHIASPATVAASAIAGCITDPRAYLNPEEQY